MPSVNSNVPYGYDKLPVIGDDQVADSCRWENRKAITPFPVWIWVSALEDAVYYRLGTHEIETKWSEFVPSIHVVSNNRGIRALMNMMQLKRFDSAVEAEDFRSTLSIRQFREIILFHIDKITEGKYFSTAERFQILINQWRSLRRSLSVDEFGNINKVRALWIIQNPKAAKQYDKSDITYLVDEPFILPENTNEVSLDGKGNETEFAKMVGRAGEEKFKDLFLSSNAFEKQIKQKASFAQPEAALVWANEQKESGKSYDFVCGDVFIEVKTTTDKRSKGFYMSEKELVKARSEGARNKYVLAKLSIGAKKIEELNNSKVEKYSFYSGNEVSEMGLKPIKYWVNQPIDKKKKTG